MATINGYLMGSSVINTQSVLLEEHTGFSFYGAGIIDDICIRSDDLSDNQILNTSVSTEPEWDTDVILLATMNNTADASNVTGVVGDVQSWDIYRQDVVTGIITTVVKGIDATSTSWIDWKAEGNRTYQYQIYCNTESQMSMPIISDDIKMAWYGYFLISSDADSIDWDTNQNVEVFKFDLNLTSDKVINNNDATYQKSFGKYDSVTIMNRDFRSGSFSSILIPQYNGDYDFMGKSNWADYLESLHTLIASKDYKFIKNRMGEIMKVSTTNTSQTSHEHQFDENNSANSQNLITETIYYNEISDI